METMRPRQMSGQQRPRQMSIPVINNKTKTISDVCSKTFWNGPGAAPPAAGKHTWPGRGAARREQATSLPSHSTEQHRSLQEYFICLTAGCNNINLPKLYTSRKVIGTEQSVL